MVPDEVKILAKKRLVKDFQETGSYVLARTSNMICPFLAIRRMGVFPFSPETKTVFIGILPLSTLVHRGFHDNELDRFRGIGCKLEPFTIFTKIRFTHLGGGGEICERLVSNIESNRKIIELVRRLNPELKIIMDGFSNIIGDEESDENLYSERLAWFIVVSKLLVKSPFYVKNIYLLVELIESVADVLRRMMEADYIWKH